MSSAECAKVRPDLTRALDGPVGPEIAIHLSDCPECARELAALRSMVLELSTNLSEPPDPGQRYWETFLPEVRGRINLQPMAIRRGPGRWLATAAALLMLVSAAAVLTHPGWDLYEPKEVVLRRLDTLLASTPSRSGIVVDLLVSMDSDLGESAGILLQADFTLEPDEFIDALDATPEWPGYQGLWDDRMERFVDRLDADAAAALRLELARENG